MKAMTVGTATSSTSQSPVPQPEEGSQTVHQDVRLSPLPPPPPPPPIAASPLLPPSNMPPSQLITVPQHSSHHFSLAHNVKTTYYTSSIPVPMPTVVVPTLSSTAAPIPAPAMVTVSKVGPPPTATPIVAPAVVPVSRVDPPPGFGVPHRYKFSVDLRSIHNTALDSSVRCYLRSVVYLQCINVFRGHFHAYFKCSIYQQS